MSAFLYFLNTVCSAGQSALGKQYAAKGGSASVFNINKAASGTVIFLLLGIVGGMRFDRSTVLYGAIYGIFLCASMHTGLKALGLGPMALTSIIASFSLIIPFLFGITVLKEKITLLNLFGTVLLLAAIVVLNMRRESGFSVKWFFYALFTMLANGICSVIQKCHQIAFPGQYRTEFTLSALLTVLFILSALSVKEHSPVRAVPSGLTAGAMNGISNYAVLCLASGEKAAVLFPMVSIINILAVWLIGRVVFKERLRAAQIVGLILGMTAVILLKL